MNGEAPPAVIAVGASAGGVEALIDLIGALPEDFAAPVLVVLHLAPSAPSALAAILGRRAPLHVATARTGEPLEAGRVYVAPPDEHLVITDGRVQLNRLPRENGHRPAVDPTFRSVAESWGARAIGVVLSGNRDDGSRGLAAIKAAGGRAFVQDPDECLYRGMPDSAIRATPVDGVLSIAGIAERLVEMTREDQEVVPAMREPEDDPEMRATRFTCPDCGGTLSHGAEHGAETYRCSVGHAYSPESLEEEQARLLESALWAAVRTLEDRAVLLRRLAERAAGRAAERSHHSYLAQAHDAADRADLIRAIVTRPVPEADVA